MNILKHLPLAVGVFGRIGVALIVESNTNAPAFEVVITVSPTTGHFFLVGRPGCSSRFPAVSIYENGGGGETDGSRQPIYLYFFSSDFGHFI